MIETPEDLTMLRDRFQEALEAEGYGSVHRDSDDDIRFKCDGGTYVVVFQPLDPSFVQILFPNFWSIDSEAERDRVGRVALEVMTRCKCARIFVKGDAAWASVELLVGDADWIDGSYVKRVVSMIRTACRMFETKVAAA